MTQVWSPSQKTSGGMFLSHHRSSQQFPIPREMSVTRVPSLISSTFQTILVWKETLGSETSTHHLVTPEEEWMLVLVWGIWNTFGVLTRQELHQTITMTSWFDIQNEIPVKLKLPPSCLKALEAFWATPQSQTDVLSIVLFFWSLTTTLTPTSLLSTPSKQSINSLQQNLASLSPQPPELHSSDHSASHHSPGNRAFCC